MRIPRRQVPAEAGAAQGTELMHWHGNPNLYVGEISRCIAALQIKAGGFQTGGGSWR
jgi:hypothetical protein